MKVSIGSASSVWTIEWMSAQPFGMPIGIDGRCKIDALSGVCEGGGKVQGSPSQFLKGPAHSSTRSVLRYPFLNKGFHPLRRSIWKKQKRPAVVASLSLSSGAPGALADVKDHPGGYRQQPPLYAGRIKVDAMTAATLAELLHARKIGSKKWKARCPAHHDANPSLAVSEGQNGRILLHCWAGCRLSEILGALGLETRSLFQPQTLEERRMQNRRRSEQCRESFKMQHLAREAFDDERWQNIAMRQLGAELARLPDCGASGEKTTRLFHEACSALAAGEARSAQFIRLSQLANSNRKQATDHPHGGDARFRPNAHS